MTTVNTPNMFLNYPKDLVNIITIYMNSDNIDFSTSTLSSVKFFLVLLTH